MITVQLIDNTGGGWNENFNIAEGTRIAEFFAIHRPNLKLENLNIRVNRNKVDGSYILRHGDVISSTPLKIDGAC